MSSPQYFSALRINADSIAVANSMSSKEPDKATSEQKTVYNIFGLEVPQKLTLEEARKRIEKLRKDEVSSKIIDRVEGKTLPGFEQLVGAISLEHIKARFQQVEYSWENNAYILAYRRFVAFFDHDRDVSVDDLIIASNFTYGWMPTILKFKSIELPYCASLLSSVRDGKELDDKQLKSLVALINNSYVGVSKLLHFANPEMYAIWDSRVCNFISCRSDYGYCNKIKKFTKYQEFCRKLSKSPKFAEINSRVSRLTGYDVSPMRAIEQVMFLSSHDPIVREIILEIPDKESRKT